MLITYFKKFKFYSNLLKLSLPRSLPSIRLFHLNRFYWWPGKKEALKNELFIFDHVLSLSLQSNCQIFRVKIVLLRYSSQRLKRGWNFILKHVGRSLLIPSIQGDIKLIEKTKTKNEPDSQNFSEANLKKKLCNFECTQYQTQRKLKPFF